MNVISSSIRAFLFAILNSILIFNLAVNPAFAQSASLLPNAMQQFLNADGTPISSGTVDFYVPGTSTRKTTWQDAGRTTPNTNPVSLDAGGYAKIYGFGSYRQVVKDKDANLVWDQVTNSYAIPNAGSSTGDGLNVGSILPWSGLTAPNQYVFAFGQELSRATFAELFATLTLSQSANCTSGSGVLSGVSDTSQVRIGAAIEAACISGTATVTAKTTSTYTVNVNAIATTTVTVVVFPYGNGDGSATFNVPDLRGRTLAGRDNMGNVAANRLTATYFINSAGTGVTAGALGATGGAQSHLLTTAEIPASPLTGTGTATLTVAGNPMVGLWSGAGSAGFGSGSIGNTARLPNDYGSVSSAVTVSGTVTGGGGAHTTIQPTLTINYIIKTNPDTSFLVATGVMSLGGMTGTVACGTGLSCSGQTISVAGGGTGPNGLAASIRTTTSSYTATINDYGILVNAASGAVTITLPSSPSVGQVILVKKIDPTSNFVTVSGNGKTIDGMPSQIISSQWSSLALQCDGSSWYIE